MKIKIKNDRNILISNGTFIDYGEEATSEMATELKASDIPIEMIDKFVIISAGIISSLYEKMYGTCVDDDIEIF